MPSCVSGCVDFLLEEGLAARGLFREGPSDRGAALELRRCFEADHAHPIPLGAGQSPPTHTPRCPPLPTAAPGAAPPARAAAYPDPARWGKTDPRAVGWVLRSYLRELPTPLLGGPHYENFVEAGAAEDDELPEAVAQVCGQLANNAR